MTYFNDAQTSSAWPFEEARKLVARLKKAPKEVVIFETGYGPSGLPHLGTFGEVARTTMVRNAFHALTDHKIKTRLIAFSDDLDGLRKVPDNVPNKELLAENLGKSLTQVPDPFGTHSSFGAHNNARLRAFLDQFGFDYEFVSSTQMYQSGVFDKTLLLCLERYEKIMGVMLPTLGAERRATYSPFLPIHPKTGVVMQVPMKELNISKGTVIWEDEGKSYETLVTGGHVKLQWKPDWAMRWTALGIDYEMAGKDLIESVKVSGQVCKVLGGTPPEGFNYELFLDEKGQKISKSKGNGLTIEDWLTYASPESLSLYMYQQPKTAKRLHFDVIPRNVDDYQAHLEKFSQQDTKTQLMNPVWHIHNGIAPDIGVSLNFSMLMNLVSASNADNKATLWNFIKRYAPASTPENAPKLDALVGYAVRYYHDFVKPLKQFKIPDAEEMIALTLVKEKLQALGVVDADSYQTALYELGRSLPRFQDFNAKNATPEKPGVTAAWFSTLYQLLLGTEKGPRLGSFIALYGVKETIGLIDEAMGR